MFTTLSCSLPLIFSFWPSVLPDTPSVLLCPFICLSFLPALSFHLSSTPLSESLFLFYSVALSCFVGHCFSLYLSVLFPHPIFLIAMLCCCPDLFSSSHPHLVLIFLCPFCLSSLPCVSRWDSPRGRWCCLQVSCFSGGLGSAGLMVGL